MTLLRERVCGADPGTGRGREGMTHRADSGPRRTVPVHLMVPPTRPRGHRDLRTRTVACGQRAGLRTRGHVCRGRHLMAVASRTRSGPVRMTAVVPTHRCGAVPDSHRVPSYDTPPGGQGEPAAPATLRGRPPGAHRCSYFGR
ncbi:hypothetical protein SGL43_07302 [Streptomyces globisporus]|uniref:Uncharacterized protein n=1 Tax=Streptomyces globisporus TaxID=1908 RepID=A0ABM9H979_STRGL|nr:hypothetical protein SGL43_07302 [Streptomyces globisporus]